MKINNYKIFWMALAAALSLASCVRDAEDNGKGDYDRNTLAFSLASRIETRSASDPAPGNTLSIPLGDPVDGHQVYLEETVTTLDGPVPEGPETRGTPVYTENFSNMFTAFSGAGYAASGTELTPVVEDGPFTRDEGRWVRKFPSDPFAGNDELYFFFHAPSTLPGVSNLAYSINSSGRCIIDFDYTVPLAATDQQDLVFSGRPVPKAEARKADILFHHALTGIKFATDNDNSDPDVQTYISKVEFPNALFRSAHFTITTTWEDGQWRDNPDYYSSSQVSSGGARTVRVSSGQQLKSTEVFSQTFTDTDVVTFAEGGTFADKGAYPESFSHSGNVKNVNAADGSKTFWLIPQAMNNNVVMDVTFHVISGGKDSGPVTRRVEIGKALSGVEWKAGELRTYTLKADLVDVSITDTVTGFEKTNVTITNTGNADAFIRAHIAAAWFGKAGGKYCLAIGNSSQTGADFVDAWRMTGTTGDNYGGVFEGLPGSGWVLATDGYFYHKAVVPAGEDTAVLFTRYSIDASAVPEVWYHEGHTRKLFMDMELVMDIPVQAIEAQPGKNYIQAWASAGVTVTPVQ